MNALPVTLYMNPVSTACRPVSLLIAEKKMPVSERLVDLMKGEHRGSEFIAKNPCCLVPVLEEGDFRMAESSAILKYLASRFDAPEYPKDARQRAKVDEAMDWFNTQFYRDFGYGFLYPQVFPHHKRPTEEQQQGTIAWGKDKARTWLGILDQNMLGPNDYVANNRISIADYFGACLVTAGELIGCTFNGYPNVQRWLSRMKKLPSWPKVNEVMNGFAASLRDKKFQTV
jgi:glutathione S-transferase